MKPHSDHSALDLQPRSTPLPDEFPTPQTTQQATPSTYTALKTADIASSPPQNEHENSRHRIITATK